MAKPPKNPEQSLRNLGDRLRHGLAQQTTQEKHMEAARQAIRDQWHQEQDAKRKRPPPEPERGAQDRKPNEPDMGR